MRPHRPRRRFGQNFLVDGAVIRRMVAQIAPQPAEHVVEIGPGRGALTRPLLETAVSLDVIELDRDLIPGLESLAGDGRTLRIHCADALRFDFARLARGTPLRLVGNLPYNISTPLLFHLLDQVASIQDMHFTLQKEVVERLAAGPGSDAYGRLSVTMQWRCRVEPLFIIAPGAFKPVPKVESAFVRLIPHAQPPVTVEDENRFREVVRRAFAQRRKTLRNTLKGLLDADDIRACGIDPGARAERLGLEAFARLGNRLVQRLPR